LILCQIPIAARAKIRHARVVVRDNPEEGNVNDNDQVMDRNLLVTENDAAFCEVVRGHLHLNAVAREHFDPVPLQTARCVGDHLVVIVELHA
jgi:hypothetical protein